LDSAALVELGEEGAPDLQPDAFFLPELKPSPASTWTWVLLGEILPSSARTQDPENPLKNLAIIGPGATSTSSTGQQRLDLLPLPLR
jgi:hypothetical protein